jgi:hypothetical protein
VSSVAITISDTLKWIIDVGEKGKAQREIKEKRARRKWKREGRYKSVKRERRSRGKKVKEANFFLILSSWISNIYFWVPIIMRPTGEKHKHIDYCFSKFMLSNTTWALTMIHPFICLWLVLPISFSYFLFFPAHYFLMEQLNKKSKTKKWIFIVLPFYL